MIELVFMNHDKAMAVKAARSTLHNGVRFTRIRSERFLNSESLSLKILLVFSAVGWSSHKMAACYLGNDCKYIFCNG